MPTPTPIPTSIPTDSTSIVLARLQPWMLIVIILAALIALMLSLYLVYSYINNIRTTDIHHKMLYDAVFESRYRVLQEQEPYYSEGWQEDAEWVERERSRALSELEELQATLNKLESQRKLSRYEAEEKAEVELNIRNIQRDLNSEFSEERILELKKKEEQEKKLWQQRDQEIRKKATKEADTLVPPSLTVAGMGITGSFFIELTAILTIIFGIIILGLVGVLGTQEISTILAAIAGYVLGKTSAGSQTSQPSAPQTSVKETPSEQKLGPPRV